MTTAIRLDEKALGNLLALKRVAEKMLEVAIAYDWEALAALQAEEQRLKAALEVLAAKRPLSSYQGAEEIMRAIAQCHQQTLDIVEPRRDHIRQYIQALK